MKLILLLLAILLLLPFSVEAVDHTINHQDSTSDAKMRESHETTNYGTTTTCEAGFEGTYCGDAGRTTWHWVDLDGVTEDTCSAMLIIVFMNTDAADGTADTLDVFRCTRSPVVGEMTWDIYSSGNNWTTGGGDFDTTHASGFWQDDGAFVITDIAEDSYCTLTVAHAGIDSMIQGTLTNNGLIIVGRSLWRGTTVNCTNNANDRAQLYYRSEDYTTADQRPQYVLTDIGTPVAGGSASQVIIIGGVDEAISSQRYASIAGRYWLR